MNTPAQCGVIKPLKTDIYSEAPQVKAPAFIERGRFGAASTAAVRGCGGESPRLH